MLFGGGGWKGCSGLDDARLTWRYVTRALILVGGDK